MKSLAMLIEEHQGIEAMLTVSEAVAGRLDAGLETPRQMLRGLVEYFAGFANGCHDLKEETGLFPLLARHSYHAHDSIVGGLMAQHELARHYLSQIRAAITRCQRGNTDIREELAAVLRAYGVLEREHIHFENEHCFPLAATVLTAAEDRKLASQFAEMSRVLAASGEGQRYCQLQVEYQTILETWKNHVGANPATVVAPGTAT